MGEAMTRWVVEGGGDVGVGGVRGSIMCSIWTASSRFWVPLDTNLELHYMVMFSNS